MRCGDGDEAGRAQRLRSQLLDGGGEGGRCLLSQNHRGPAAAQRRFNFPPGAGSGSGLPHRLPEPEPRKSSVNWVQIRAFALPAASAPPREVISAVSIPLAMGFRQFPRPVSQLAQIATL